MVKPTVLEIFFNDLNASGNKIDSLRLPGALINGAITFKFLSQKATTLSPVRCL